MNLKTAPTRSPRRIFLRLLLWLAGLLAVLAGVVYALTNHPKPVQAADLTCPANTSALKSGQDVKVMSWNVQYLAGRG